MVYERPLMLTCIIKRWQVKICVAYYATLDPVWQDHLSKGSAIALVGPFQDLKKNAPMHPASLCPGYCNGSEVGPAGLYYCFYSSDISRFQFQIPHQILISALATDQKCPLCHFHISYQNSKFNWQKIGILLRNKVPLKSF